MTLEELCRLFDKINFSPDDEWLPPPPTVKQGSSFKATVEDRGTCDNCGKPFGRNAEAGECFGPRYCKEELDNDRIAKNKAAREARSKASKEKKGGTTSGDDKDAASKARSLQSKTTVKWAPVQGGSTPNFNPANDCPPSVNKSYVFQNQPYAYCKTCKWNTTHATKHHVIAMTDPQINICVADSEHHLARALALMSPSQRPGSDRDTTPPAGPSAGAGMNSCSKSTFTNAVSMMKENADSNLHLNHLCEFEETLAPLFTS